MTTFTLYAIYGIVGILVLLIAVLLIGFIISRGSTPKDDPAPTVEPEVAAAGGFFANEKNSTNLVADKAKLDGNRSAANFLEDALQNRSSLPSRESTHDEADDEFKL